MCFRCRQNASGLMAAGTLVIHQDNIRSLQTQLGSVFQVFILFNLKHSQTHLCVLKCEQLKQFKYSLTEE